VPHAGTSALKRMVPGANRLNGRRSLDVAAGLRSHSTITIAMHPQNNTRATPSIRRVSAHNRNSRAKP
jgi:hypothetical protein